MSKSVSKGAHHKVKVAKGIITDFFTHSWLYRSWCSFFIFQVLVSPWSCPFAITWETGSLDILFWRVLLFSCPFSLFSHFYFADRAYLEWKSASWVWFKYMPQCVSVGLEIFLHFYLLNFLFLFFCFLFLANLFYMPFDLGITYFTSSCSRLSHYSEDRMYYENSWT